MIRAFLSTFLLWLSLVELVLGNLPTNFFHGVALIIATCAGIVGAASS